MRKKEEKMSSIAIRTATGTSGWSTGNTGRGMALSFKGISPQQVVTKDNTATWARERWVIVQGMDTSRRPSMCGPFRTANHSGDRLSRQSYSCGGPDQGYQSRPGIHGMRMLSGHIGSTCMPSVAYSALQLNAAEPAASGNVKFVADSSLYTTFKRRQATKRSFNDKSFGGNDFHANQVPAKAIRRY